MLRIDKMRIPNNQRSTFPGRPAASKSSRPVRRETQQTLSDVRLLAIAELDIPIGSWPEPWGLWLNKKADAIEHPRVFDHIGLLLTGLP